MVTYFIQDMMLVFAVSVDAFIAAFSFGAGKIRIPPLSALIVSAVCTAILTVSLMASGCLRDFIPDFVCKAVGASILTVMGTVSLFQNMLKSALRKRQGEGGLKFRFSNIEFVLCIYLDETKADSDRSKSLSVREAAVLALALSADSVASGLGAGMGDADVLRIAAAGLVTGLIALGAGDFLGRKASCRRLGLSWLSGTVLILLGVLRCVS